MIEIVSEILYIYIGYIVNVIDSCGKCIYLGHQIIQLHLNNATLNLVGE